ncbi:MAG: hypothetical protein NUV88_03360 [Candidatus Kaiserbacteria bacterium]|nr:hypothetical protein [Candidatus Kaiserbacteria bacterium]
MKKTTSNKSTGTIGHIIPGRGKLSPVSVAGHIDGDGFVASLPVKGGLQRSAGTEVPLWRLSNAFNLEAAYQNAW